MVTPILKAAAYHGISNAKYSPRISENNYSKTLLSVHYMINLSHNPAVETQERYADNRLILTAVSDQGATGNIGSTAPDTALEQLLGWKIPGATGELIDVGVVALSRGAFYFETIIEREGSGPQKAKVWILNIELSRSSEEFKTKQKAPDFGDYSYAYSAYGEPLLSLDGKRWLDEDGLERTALRLISLPGDTGYATFGDTVPTPTAADEAPVPGEPGEGD